ncbi:heavy-metal-associated domain-containing protein [Streptomyces sp. NPDC088254]|uniref:heavy-metal-associated domain-containing protein n=1 Tax=Streptomyces sp. NPDC088254 TaxID=3365847 RepID=UPI0038055473
MAEKTYTVFGMSCGHCAASITEEVVEVPGVTEVDVDVPTGRVTVHGESVDDDAVRAAITEAGYEVTAAVHDAAA